MLVASYNLNGMNIIRKGLMRYAKPFFTTSKGFAKGMRGFNNVAFFSITYGLIGYGTFADYMNIKIYSDVSPYVAKFTQETLKKYGYLASFYTSVRLKKAPPIINSICAPLSICILIPFSKAQLLKAQTLYNNNENLPIPIEDKEDSFKKRFFDLTMPEDIFPKKVKETFMEEFGLAVNPTTLLLWQNAILHEASHIEHRDAWQQIALISICPLAIHYASKKLAKSLHPNIPILQHNANNIVRGLAAAAFLPVKLGSTALAIIAIQITVGKWHEYRADQNIIKRVSDPQALKKEAEWYCNKAILNDTLNNIKLADLEIEKAEAQDTETYQACLKKEQKIKRKIEFYKKYPWLEELCTTHPREVVRSAYFAAAAEKLRKK